MKNIRALVLAATLFIVVSGCSQSSKKLEKVTDSQDAQFYFNRGYEHQDHGQLDKAISDYTKVIEMKPEFADAYFNRGNAHKDKGLLDLAISDYSKAIEINPEDAAAYNNRGIAYIEKKEVTTGCNDIRRSCELGMCGLYDFVKSKGICQ